MSQNSAKPFPEITPEDVIEKAIQAHAAFGWTVPESIKAPEMDKATGDYVKGQYWGWLGLGMHYAAGVKGLYDAANAGADPYDRVTGGAAFVEHASEALAGLLESMPEAETVSHIGIAGASEALSLVLSIAGAELEVWKAMGAPYQDAAKDQQESGRDGGNRLGFSAGILTSDHAWVNNQLLGTFLHPIPGEDEFGQMHREAFVNAFIESYREAQNMPAAAKKPTRLASRTSWSVSTT